MANSDNSPSVKGNKEISIDMALTYALVPLAMGVTSVNSKLKIDIDVISRLKARYRTGMTAFFKLHGDESDFPEKLQHYLTIRGTAIGKQAARMAAEKNIKSIDADLFEQAALPIEKKG